MMRVPNIKIRQTVLTITRLDRLDIRMSIHKGIVRTITEYIHKTSAQFANFSVLSEIPQAYNEQTLFAESLTLLVSTKNKT